MADLPLVLPVNEASIDQSSVSDLEESDPDDFSGRLSNLLPMLRSPVDVVSCRLEMQDLPLTSDSTRRPGTSLPVVQPVVAEDESLVEIRQLKDLCLAQSECRYFLVEIEDGQRPVLRMCEDPAVLARQLDRLDDRPITVRAFYGSYLPVTEKLGNTGDRYLMLPGRRGAIRVSQHPRIVETGLLAGLPIQVNGYLGWDDIDEEYEHRDDAVESSLSTWLVEPETEGGVEGEENGEDLSPVSS